MSDMRKWLDIVNEKEIDENKFTDLFKSREKKDHEFRQKIGQSRANALDSLADKIEELGLEKETIAMIDKVSTGWRNIIGKESAENDEELVEKYIDDKGIKQVLVQIIQHQAYADNDEGEPHKIEQYLTTWKQALSDAYNDMREVEPGSEFKYDGVNYRWAGRVWEKENENGKWVISTPKKGDPSKVELTDAYLKRIGKDYDIDELTKEMVNFLADRKGSPEWRIAARQVKQAISSFAGQDEAEEVRELIDNGKYMEQFMYDILTPILEECGGKWVDFGYNPIRVENGYVVMEACVPKRDVSMEEFLTDVVMFDKIEQMLKKHGSSD